LNLRLVERQGQKWTLFACKNYGTLWEMSQYFRVLMHMTEPLVYM